MSIFDDIAGAFEDLFNEIKKGVDTVFNSIVNLAEKVTQAVELAFRKTAEIAETVVDALKDVGITLSQGVVDGANIAINFVEKTAQDVLDRFKIPEVPEPTPEYKQAISKAIASVFSKIAAEGQEYDVFGILASACNAKDLNYQMLELGSKIAAERLGNDIFNIPTVAPVIVSKELLKEYINFLIIKAVQDNRQKVANGKSVQVVTGIVITAITLLVTEGRIADWGWEIPEGMQPDKIDSDATTVWTEGSRLQFNNAIYLVLDGQVRHIPNPATFDNLFANGNGVIQSEPGLQVEGKPLTDGAYLVTANGGDGKYYLVADGVKRWISTPQVFKKYAFDNAKVKKVSTGDLDKIPTGDTIYQFSKREGSMLTINGAVHIIIDKVAHHIPNENTYNQLFKNWNGIQETNRSSIKIGEPITNGAYLASATERVYFISNGQKRWIMSPLAFNNFNFGWNKIRKVSQADLDRIPNGKEIY
ncbi:hypothetical protein D0C36_08870 [Mucilaginibacter conchicola]|uniref:Uncharacterized protein n=1 Tax=Mucilaginibacter conchicola TaxID=2303333 RepID=A0A372P0A7_9SPHI|nr:hypothetical protein [Mucilaginibacter conchicola]RFZ95611.1 hypothetical protein D0C36_08870 [Mucilaginibacter conchicola]